MSVDPVQLKITWDRLVSAVDAATHAQRMSAFSTAVAEANDFACGLMALNGDLIATSGLGMPSFANMMPSYVRSLVEKGILDGVRPGDILICNDPWTTAAQVNDIGVVEPIFRDGVLQGHAVSVAHNPDIGGPQEWSRARDVFEEGLQIPPVKLFDAGVRNEALWAMFAANSRVPEQTLGDIEAQLVATHSISSRVVEILEDQGPEQLGDWADELMARTAARMAEAVAAIPDGTYRAEKVYRRRDTGILDGGDEDIELRVAITIAGDRLTADYSGTSGAVPGSVNGIGVFTSAYTIFTLHTLLAPEIPHNDGFAENVDVVLPHDSALSAARPRPTLYRHLIGHRVADLLSMALAETIPGKARAEGGSGPAWTLILTPTGGTFKDVPRIFAIAGGTGASGEAPGQTVQYPVNIATTPIETLERTLPIEFARKRVDTSSGGSGKFAGGNGQQVDFTATEEMVCVFQGGNIETAPRGLFGGGDGRAGVATLDGEPILPGSFVVPAGSRLVFETPGGGGYGSAS
jgi:N-methylhydantoinase B